jgi:GTPase KRas
MAQTIGCRFLETSAKQRINIDEAFYEIVREIRRANKVGTFVVPLAVLFTIVFQAKAAGRNNFRNSVAPPGGVSAQDQYYEQDSGCCAGCVVL